MWYVVGTWTLYLSVVMFVLLMVITVHSIRGVFKLVGYGWGVVCKMMVSRDWMINELNKNQV